MFSARVSRHDHDLAVMLQLLDARQLGIEPVWLAPRVYGSNKMTKLELSKEKEVQKGHSNGVTALDIDPISSR